MHAETLNFVLQITKAASNFDYVFSLTVSCEIYQTNYKSKDNSVMKPQVSFDEINSFRRQPGKIKCESEVPSYVRN